MQTQTPYSIIGKAAKFYDFCLHVVGYEKSVNYFVSQLPISSNEAITVLDAGCGTGLYTLAVLKKYPNAQVVAFDLNEKLIERLREKVEQNQYSSRVRVFSANVESPLYELREQLFSLIITAGVLEYVPLDKTVTNLSRFVTSGGYFLNSPVRTTLCGKIIAKIYGCKPYTQKQNIEAFQRNNFTLLKIIHTRWNMFASFKEAHLFKKH